MIKADPAPPDRLLSIRDIAKLCRVSVRTVFRYLAQDLLPVPVRIGVGPKAPYRWQESVIFEWLAAGCPPRCEANDDFAGTSLSQST